MILFGILGLAFVIAGLMAFLNVLRDDEPAPAPLADDSRLQRWVDSPDEEVEFIPEPVEKATFRQSVDNFIDKGFGARMEDSARGRRIADELARTDIKMRPYEWILIQFGLSLFFALLFFVRLGNPIWLLLGLPVGYFLPGIYLKRRQNRRKAKFESQLGEVVMALSNAIRSGRSFQQSLAYVSEDAPDPIGSELNRVLREMNYGVLPDEALSNMVRRNQSDDVELMAVAIQVHRQVGGDLTEVLDNISDIIRQRIRIKGEIRTLTSQARMSAWVISLLPIGLALILSLIAPDYFTPILQSVFGVGMLILGGISMLIGVGIIRKIIQVRV